jgi:DnaJ-domain-containing protein 1
VFLQLRQFRISRAMNRRQPLSLSQFESRQASLAARLALGLALLLVFALPGRAQMSGPGISPSVPPPYEDPGDAKQVREFSNFPDTDPAAIERRLRALNAERQRSMVSDADKLLKLARELEEEISRTNPESLTEDQLRTIAKIEKLAHSVRDKMSNSVQGVLVNPQYPTPRIR